MSRRFRRRRAPGFAAVAILTLALANGAATAIFTVIDAALLRPLPYDKPEEIVYITVAKRPSSGCRRLPTISTVGAQPVVSSLGSGWGD